MAERTLVKMRSLMMGKRKSSFIDGVSNLGITIFLMIFSMMRGTLTTTFGLTSAKACTITFGVGLLVR